MSGGLSERLSDLGYRAGWAAVRFAPEPVARTVFDTVGAVAGRRRGGPRQLRRNLARVIGTTPEQVPDELVVAAVQSYARYWREAFRLPTADPAEIAANVRISDADTAMLDAAVARGKGLVLALPHSGNWDSCGVWLVNRHGQFSTVAERLKPESLFEQFVAYRESLGFEVFPLTGGEQPPFDLLRERLRDGKVICLMGDRDLSRSGVPVQLFGERTRIPAGPAKLALDTGAALIAEHHRYTGPDTSLMTLTEIDTDGTVAQLSQRLADAYEAGIAGAPADWHMLQPLWESDWSDERRERLAEPQS